MESSNEIVQAQLSRLSLCVLTRSSKPMAVKLPADAFAAAQPSTLLIQSPDMGPRHGWFQHQKAAAAATGNEHSSMQRYETPHADLCMSHHTAMQGREEMLYLGHLPDLWRATADMQRQLAELC